MYANATKKVWPVRVQGGSEIPYLMSANVRADHIYCLDYNVEGRDINHIAKSRDLPIEEIRQSIEWCTENDDLVARVLAQERKEAGVKD